MKKIYKILLPALFCIAPLTASAQSFRVQCPTSTITHPVAANNNSEPAYTGPTAFTTAAAAAPPSNNAGGYLAPSSNVNGAIKCQQISGGDGYSTMGDGTQTYMFSFGPLSGIADLANGLPGTEFPNVFNDPYSGANSRQPGDPATADGVSLGCGFGAPCATVPFAYNGAIGL